MKGSLDMTYHQPTRIQLSRAAHLQPKRALRRYPWVIAGVLLGHAVVFAGMVQVQPKLITPPPPKPVQIRLVQLAPPPPPPQVTPKPVAPRVPDPIKPKTVPVTPPPAVIQPPPKLIPTAAPVAKPVARPIERPVEIVPTPAPVLTTPVQVPVAVTPVMAKPVAVPVVAPVAAPAQPVASIASADPTPRTVAIEGVSYKRQPQVEYPDQARRRGDTGTVLIRALISENGRVDVASVEQSSGNRLLDQAGIRAVKRASFHPYRENGDVQSVYVLIPIAFNLNKD